MPASHQSCSLAWTWPLVTFGVQAHHCTPPGTETAPADTKPSKFTIPKDGCQALVGLLAVGTFVITFGFILGTVTINVLRAGFSIARFITGVVHKRMGIQNRKGCYFYELWQDPDSIERIWRNTTSTPINHTFFYYAGVTSDHDLSINNENIHKWTMRRWNSFNTNANCAMAIILSHLIAPFLPGPMNLKLTWFLISSVFWLLFAFNAIMAWRQTMEMIRFQAIRREKKDEPKPGAVCSCFIWFFRLCCGIFQGLR
jgi:hypothetical protein